MGDGEYIFAVGTCGLWDPFPGTQALQGEIVTPAYGSRHSQGERYLGFFPPVSTSTSRPLHHNVNFLFAILPSFALLEAFNFNTLAAPCHCCQGYSPPPWPRTFRLHNFSSLHFVTAARGTLLPPGRASWFCVVRRASCTLLLPLVPQPPHSPLLN